MLYDIWMRCYPQADVNVTEEWELPPVTLKEANVLIADLEEGYGREEWKGHRLYNARFYPEERK